MGSKPCQDQILHPIMIHCWKIRKIQVAKWGTPRKIFTFYTLCQKLCLFFTLYAHKPEWISINLLFQKLFVKWWWNWHQVRILPTCLWEAFMLADPKSAKKTNGLFLFIFCFFGICTCKSCTFNVGEIYLRFLRFLTTPFHLWQLVRKRIRWRTLFPHLSNLH